METRPKLEPGKEGSVVTIAVVFLLVGIWGGISNLEVDIGEEGSVAWWLRVKGLQITCFGCRALFHYVPLYDVG